MKRCFLTGLIILLPIALTVIIVVYLFDLFTTPFAGAIEAAILSYEAGRGLSAAHHASIVLFVSRIIALLLLVGLIFLLGFLGQRYFFHSFTRIGNRLLLRIPVVKTIYRISREVTKALFAGDKKTFRQTVLIPFPKQDTYALGFVTGNIPEGLRTALLQTGVSVFVPTAPHPLSGFLLLSAPQETHSLDVTVEDAFKFLVSCGTFQPGTVPPDNP
jgi:uncharacterized membrane protein